MDSKGPVEFEMNGRGVNNTLNIIWANEPVGELIGLGIERDVLRGEPNLLTDEQYKVLVLDSYVVQATVVDSGAQGSILLSYKNAPSSDRGLRRVDDASSQRVMDVHFHGFPLQLGQTIEATRW